MKGKIFLGHLAAAVAYFIFGFNIVTCKNVVTGSAVSPMDLFCMRAVGAMALFWLLSFFMPAERVEKGDYFKIFLASFFGLFLTQISFLKAVTMTTPFDTAVVASTAPIMTMFISAIFLKEPITWKKVLGVLLSFVGVLLIIFNSVHAETGVQTKPLGVLLMICNALCFALYLGIFRPLIEKYSVVTFMKWMFLFSALMSVPFDLPSLVSVDYGSISPFLLLNIAFTVFFATFVSYFLIPYSQKCIRPTLVSMYSYLQPIVAACLGIWLGMDRLTFTKVVATCLVFLGVVVVNRSRQRSDSNSKS
ncbi:MAG: DMT family transporter [Paludibacteraceae bacterium]|nr:DMT family transporter [Paludibacteraceae bacterium]